MENNKNIDWLKLKINVAAIIFSQNHGYEHALHNDVLFTSYALADEFVEYTKKNINNLPIKKDLFK